MRVPEVPASRSQRPGSGPFVVSEPRVELQHPGLPPCEANSRATRTVGRAERHPAKSVMAVTGFAKELESLGAAR
jgi:hypothetical protein